MKPSEILIDKLVPANKAKQFATRDIFTGEDLLNFLPRDYSDRSQLTGIQIDQESTVLVDLKKVDYKYGGGKQYIVGNGFLAGGETPVVIKWWNTYIYEQLKELAGKRIMVSGKVTYSTYSKCFEFSSPKEWTDDLENGLKIYPRYLTIKGMSAAYHAEVLERVFAEAGKLEEVAPPELCRKYDLMPYDDAMRELHYPSSQEQLQKAKNRLIWNDLFYYASRVELDYTEMALGSPFQFHFLQKYAAARDALPFRLTADQDKTLDAILATVRSGMRVNALIQGDVGSGKTIIAFLLMIAAAENGYQAALMAPTQILAKQHYEDLKKIAEKLGFEVGFVSGLKMKKAEQQKLEDGLSSGRIRLIVGTQALLSAGITFSKLALVITDEEHRYGVEQRETLTQKAAMGVHVVSMSATPIPRTLAQSIYGSRLSVYAVKTKPAGRKPVVTGIAQDMDRVYNYIYNEVESGHQIYIICPLVTENEKVQGLLSVEECQEQYSQVLAPYGVRIGSVSGKTKKKDAQAVLDAFAAGEIDVLVSTTLVEVGVNVPNATGIIIHNAERYGLAQLHQLRGRVGRSSLESVCCLISSDPANARLNVLCQTNDGFEIAEADLSLRGAGDLIGIKQSGVEKYLSLATVHADMYSEIQQDVQNMIRQGYTCPLMDKAAADRAAGLGGEFED